MLREMIAVALLGACAGTASAHTAPDSAAAGALRRPRPVATAPT